MPRRLAAFGAALGAGAAGWGHFEAGWVRLESSRAIGPWFRWASVGIDCAARLADDVGMALTGIHPIGSRVVASLKAA